MREWEKSEFEEIIGQGVKLVEMFDSDPGNPEIWDRLKGWAESNKSYVSDSYDPPEPKGYDIAQLDGDPDKLPF